MKYQSNEMRRLSRTGRTVKGYRYGSGYSWSKNHNTKRVRAQDPKKVVDEEILNLF